MSKYKEGDAVWYLLPDLTSTWRTATIEAVLIKPLIGSQRYLIKTSGLIVEVKERQLAKRRTD